MTRSDSRRLRERIASGLLRVYKMVLSPMLHGTGGGCGYQPTCSEYATIAVAEHGVLRGSVMAAWRVLRCNPLHRGGFDPVPAKAGTRVEGTGHSECAHFTGQWAGSHIPADR